MLISCEQEQDVFDGADEDNTDRLEPDTDKVSECLNIDELQCDDNWVSICTDYVWVRVEDCDNTNSVCKDGHCIGTSDGDQDLDPEIDVDDSIPNDGDMDLELEEDQESDIEDCVCGPEITECCDGCKPRKQNEGCLPFDPHALGGICNDGYCEISICEDGYYQIDPFTCEEESTDGDLDLDIDLDSDPFEVDLDHELDEEIDFDNGDHDEAEIIEIDEDVIEKDVIEKELDIDDDITECLAGPCCIAGQWVTENQPCVSGQDDFDCTVDFCNAGHVCIHELYPEFCLIEDECIPENNSSDANECLVCIPDTNPIDWIPAENETECSDGNDQTYNDSCQNGQCLGVGCECNQINDCCNGCLPINESGVCSDSNPCTTGDSCTSGLCFGNPVDCSWVTDPCLQKTCNPDSGQCNLPVIDGLSCDDDTLCNGREQCLNGECQPGIALDCYNDDPCKEGYCDTDLGCQVHNLNNVPCDNDTICDGREICQNGICSTGTALECEISDPCNFGYCDPVSGCQTESVHDGTSCDDGDPCNGTEICISGQCSPGEVLDCEQTDPCIEVDCIENEGCVESDAPLGTPCDDGNEDTEYDYCENGVCQSGEASNLPVSFVPSTGLTICYDDGAEISCGNETSAWDGQDADYEHPDLQYVIVAANRLIEDVVEDQVTGLYWQRSAPTTTFNLTSATSYCDTLAIGGRDDWRLPNRRELLSIVDYSKAGGQVAAIDSIFENTYKTWYWTSDGYAINPSRTFQVYFKYGLSNHQDNDQDGYVRCVAGESAYSQEELYVVAIEDGVYDPTTGLMWQRSPSGYLDWQAALDYCRNLDQVGFDDWRLPNVKELSTLLHPNSANPVLDDEVFPGIRTNQVFWSSTTYNDPVRRNNAYTVALGDDGTVNKATKASSFPILCVRSCPCPDPRCCYQCEPRMNGTGCDDGDPDTIRDQCQSGVCKGVESSTPEPSPLAPFDCRTLSCEDNQYCVRIDGIESCVCKFGYRSTGDGCTYSYETLDDADSVCAEFDTGIENTCLLNTPFNGESFNGESKMRSSCSSWPDNHVIHAPGDPGEFRTHGQHASEWCYVHATTAGTELLLGDKYVPLSEAHALAVAYGNVEDVPKSCKTDMETFLENLLNNYSDDSSTRPPALVCDDKWDISYEGRGCNDVHLDESPTEEALQANEVAIPHLINIKEGHRVNLDNIRCSLSSGNPVMINVPVIRKPDEWLHWTSGEGLIAVISTSPWDSIERTGKCGSGWFGNRDASKCYCEEHSDCKGVSSSKLCIEHVCVEGYHAIILIGYDDRTERFWFLNSWDTATNHWGMGRFGYSAGLGLMNYDFVERFADGVLEFSGIEVAPIHQDTICDIGSTRCIDGDPARIEVCQEVDSTCHERDFVFHSFCDSNEECGMNGQCIRKMIIGDGDCIRDENCANSPEDCACQAFQTCEAGICTPENPETCGNGICALGEENCASCPEDCSCSQSGESHCTASGQCVRCLQDSHCPSGYTCDNNACVAGCNECSSVGQHRCEGSASRQTCELVGNCKKWVGDNCPSGYSCCDGGCSSTTPPDSPSLSSPSNGQTLTEGSIRFEWANSSGMDRATLKVCTSSSLSGNCPVVRELNSGVTSYSDSLGSGTYWWSVRGITDCDTSGWGEFATPRQLIIEEPIAAEVCNGIDDDGDGRIDNTPPDGMGCMREIFPFVRIGDNKNYRMQWSGNGGNGTPGIAPPAPNGYQDPTWFDDEGRHPSFLMYHDDYGISGLTKLYYCVRTVGSFDNLYTTNLTECANYQDKGENKFIGYIWTSNPGSGEYANWLYWPYANNETSPIPLYRLRYPATNQHQFMVHVPRIEELVGLGWCCERGPASECAGHWCNGTVNTSPVGWVLR